MSIDSLNREAFNIDSSEVFVLIVKFIVGNEMTETKIRLHVSTSNYKKTFKVLVAHYKAVGLHFIDIIKTDEVINFLLYTGKKKPRIR